MDCISSLFTPKHDPFCYEKKAHGSLSPSHSGEARLYTRKVSGMCSLRLVYSLGLDIFSIQEYTGTIHAIGYVAPPRQWNSGFNYLLLLLS